MRAQVLAALEESLAAIPNPADVWSGVQAGIDRRHRRNRYYRTGLAITAVALVLIVSLAAAAVSQAPRERQPAGIPVGEWINSIRPTWVPEGFVAQEFTATLAGMSATYHADNFDLLISISSAEPIRSLGTERWQEIEINGRPAREASGPGRTLLAFQLPSGRWAEVALLMSYLDDSDTRVSVREPAVRVARSLEESGDLRLSIKFAPTYLPVGQRVVGVGHTIFTPPGFGAIVCAGSEPDKPNLYISMTNVMINKNHDLRIGDIQGRPAYRSVTGATIFVANFHGGTLAVGATNEASLYPDKSAPGTAPLSELIKIAEGVIWVG